MKLLDRLKRALRNLYKTTETIEDDEEALMMTQLLDEENQDT